MIACANPQMGAILYYLGVVLFTLVLPACSVYLERYGLGNALPSMVLVGKWFVFWAGGVRLAVAGARQILQPDFTAHTIFGIEGDAPFPFIRELGMANLSLSVVSILAVLVPGFVLPAAIAAGLFYAMAGVMHVRRGNRTAHENFAMISDLFVGAVLIAFVIWWVASYGRL